MTIGSQMVLAVMKKNFGTELTKAQLAEMAGVSLSTVNGCINGLNRKNLVIDRAEEVEEAPATETRKAKMKTVHYVMLNEDGLAYDPIAEEEAKKAEQAAKRAAKKSAEADA